MQDGAGGALVAGDVRDAALQEYAGKAQCVYMDPPFFTGERFVLRMRVGDDGWQSGKRALTLPAFYDRAGDSGDEYLAMLRAALDKAYALLSPSGSLFLHLDSRMHARARMLCDEVFGEENFLNEIIWAYQTGGRAKRYFSRKHDVILFYRKSPSHFFDIEQVPLPRSENRSNHMKRTVDEHGRPCRTINTGGKTYVYYDDDPVFPDDVWTDVSHLQQKDPQRTGYDTQKPLALLDRIVKCATRPGDLVCDLFCGSGTALVSAAGLGREYLGLDKSERAIAVSRKRLLGTRLSVRAPLSDTGALVDAALYPGIGYYDVRLNDYTLPKGALADAGASPKGMTLAALDAVDQWSVGFLRGNVFECYASAARRKQTPALPETLQLPLLRGRVAILIVDVLGNRTLWTA